MPLVDPFENQNNGLVDPYDTPDKTTTPQEMSFSDKLIREGKGVAKGAIETLPYVGAVAGGILAAPANVVAPGVSEVVGAGLGYLGGTYAKKALLRSTGLEDQPDLSLKDVVTKDIPEAAIVGMSGPIGDKVIGATLRSAGKIIKPILGKLQGTGAGAETEAIELLKNNGYKIIKE